MSYLSVVPVGIGTARNGEVEIAYEAIGNPTGEPILLVMGLTAQMVAWPDDFCAALVDRGFHVVRFDNRDCGLSTHLEAAGKPGLRALRDGTGATYTLDHMADDAVAVMDSLGWRSAHVAGVSMGGMIAQVLAVRHPDRVRSLTSFMAAPCPRVGQIGVGTILRMARVGRQMSEPHTSHQAGRNLVEFLRITSSPGFPFDEDWVYELGRRMFERDSNPGAGGHRQNAAIRASGDRRAELAVVRVPTLVLHGGSDTAIRPVAGLATAAAIPGARLVIYPGMGHDLPRDLWPDFVDRICALAAEATLPRQAAGGRAA